MSHSPDRDVDQWFAESLLAIRRLAAAGVRAADELPPEDDEDVVEAFVDGLFQARSADRVRRLTFAMSAEKVYDSSAQQASSSLPLRAPMLKDIIGATEAARVCARGGAMAGLTVPLVSRDGSVEWFVVETSEESTPSRASDAALATTLRDVAASALAVRQVRSQATVDHLTGCLNRAGMEQQLERDVAHAARTGSRLCCVIFDIDDLKIVNDLKGHGVGDAVIRHVADALRSERRPYDSCARYGGDEFVLILPGSGVVDAGRAAERMRSAAAARGQQDPQIDFALNVTAGVAEWREGDSYAELLRRADHALITAKADVKGGIGFAK